MRVICCGEVKPECKAALDKYCPDVTYVPTPNPFDYPDAIRRYWTGESDLIVIEGDKEIYEGTLPSFEGCDKLWCTTRCVNFPAPYTRATTNSLACARFSAEIQRLVKPDEFDCPDPWYIPCPRCKGEYDRGCWNQLDTRLAIAITPHANGLPHVHGSVGHHHDYSDGWHAQFQRDWEFMMEFNRQLMEISSVEEIINHA